MGRYVFRLPDIGEGVAEAEIVAWHVKPGDVVGEDQSLVDVMTDKATVDMTSPVDGTVTALHGEIGAMMPVGSVIIELEVEGEGNAADEPGSGASAGPAPAPSPEPAPSTRGPLPPAAVAEQPSPPERSGDPKAAPAARRRRTAESPLGRRAEGEQAFASPATRRRAYELGIPLQFVRGTGPAGRILPEDLDAHLHQPAGGAADPRYVERDDVDETRIIGLRRRIAERMQDAKRRIPHIAYVEEVDVTQLEALRQDLNGHREDGQPKLTLLPLLMRALVRVLPRFPQINARYDDEAGVLHSHGAVHVGIATQTPGGLMVPVVTHAEARDVWDLAAELGRVTKAAKDGSASREELSGSTITITSLGTLGGIATTPVINHPEVAIIGPNKIVEKPIVEGGFVSVRKTMNISSSFDHRIVDGYDAALFIAGLKRLIEHPALIFMD